MKLEETGSPLPPYIKVVLLCTSSIAIGEGHCAVDEGGVLTVERILVLSDWVEGLLEGASLNPPRLLLKIHKGGQDV